MTSDNHMPDTWARDGLEVIIRDAIEPLYSEKVAIVKKQGIWEVEAVKSDIDDITLPEIFAAEICLISNNMQIYTTSAVLQAFQTYRVSLYDIRTDKHEYKLGKPTFLKKYGEKYVLSVEAEYTHIAELLAKQLEENGVKNAPALVRAQYEDTLKADKIRNNCPTRIPSVRETIKINEDVAGNTARYIARLSNGNIEMEDIAAGLADAMSTLEDLLGVINCEDLSEVKATIPLAYLQEEVGRITSDMNPAELIKKYHFAEYTMNYVQKRLGAVKELLKLHSYPDKGILNLFISDMDHFMEVFPSRVLK